MVECWLLKEPEETEHAAGGSVVSAMHDTARARPPGLGLCSCAQAPLRTPRLQLDKATDRHMMSLLGMKVDHSAGLRAPRGE